MTSNSANFLFENLVVESGFEFTLSSRSLCDTHSILATSENNKFLLGSYGSAVEGSVGDVCLQNLQVLRINEL